MIENFNKLGVAVKIIPRKISDIELASTASSIVEVFSGWGDDTDSTEITNNPRINGKALNPILKFDVIPHDFFFCGSKIFHSSFGIRTPYIESIFIKSPFCDEGSDISDNADYAKNSNYFEIRIECFPYNDGSELIGKENYDYATYSDDEESFCRFFDKAKNFIKPIWDHLFHTQRPS